MTCHITGSVVIPDGSSAANRKIVFRKEEFTLSANGTIAVLPDYITTYTNASGNVSFDLLEGTYSGYYVTAPDGRVPFRLRVPTGTATANFADLIITTSVTDDPTLTKLVLDAKAVINGGGGGGGGAAAWGTITGTLSAQTDLNTALNSVANDFDIRVLVQTTSAGISATTNGQYFAVATGTQTDLYKNVSGTATLIRSDIEKSEDIYPALATTGPILVASAAGRKVNTVPLRKILGRSYSSSTDGAGALNAALIELAAAGLTVTDPHGLTVRCTQSIRPATSGTRLVFSKATTILRDFTSTGTGAGLFCQASFTTNTDNLYIRGGVWKALQPGWMFPIWGNDMDLADMTVLDYSGGLGFGFGGDRIRFDNIDVSTSSPDTGTGAFRMLGGTGFRGTNLRGKCGDDVFQFVPVGTPGAARYGIGISDSTFESCYGESFAARVCIARIPIGVNSSNIPYEGIKNVTFENVKGISSGNAFMVQVDDNGDSTIVGTDTNCIDAVFFTGCQIKCRRSTGEPDNLPYGTTISDGIGNAIRRVTFRDCVIYDNTQETGIRVNGDSVVLNMDNCLFEGEHQAIQILLASRVNLRGGRYRPKDNGGSIIFPSSSFDHTPGSPIFVSASSGCELTIDNNVTFQDVPSNLYAVYGNAGLNIKLGKARIEKAVGATGTKAIRTVAGSSISVTEPPTGTVDDLLYFGTGTVTILYGAGATSGLAKGVYTETSTANQTYTSAAALATTVLEAAALPAGRQRNIQATGWVVGDRIKVTKTVASAGAATWKGNDGTTLAVLTNIGDSFEATYNGTNFTIEYIGPSDVPAALASYQLTSAKGAVNGYASLDASGKVPAAQLPAASSGTAVDSYANFAALPATGTTGILYVTIDNAKAFRWNGSVYVEVSPSPTNTDGLAEGSTNLYFSSGRVRTSALTGYAMSASRIALVAGDSVLGAFNKLGKWVNDLSALAFTGDWADIANKPAVLTATTASYTTAEQTKLGGIASGATANSPDATLLARANHTGTQAASTITGLATVATSGLFADLGSKPTTLAGYGITDGATTSALTSGLATKANTATTLAGYGITDGLTTTAAASTYQPLDGDLTSLAGVTGTNTIYYRSAANTWSPVAIGSNLTFSGGTLAASGGGSAWTPFSITVASGESVPCTTYGSSAAPANQSTALNAMDIYPWICPVTMTISSVSIRVNAVLASSTCKAVFYTSNASGQPDTLMFETADADTSTTGIKTLTASASLTAGTLYWVGMRSNLASIGMFSWPGSTSPDIGPSTQAGTNVFRKTLRRTLTYSTAAPTTWGYTYSEVNAATPWMIWATKA